MKTPVVDVGEQPVCPYQQMLGCSSSEKGYPVEYWTYFYPRHSIANMCGSFVNGHLVVTLGVDILRKLRNQGYTGTLPRLQEAPLLLLLLLLPLTATWQT